MNQTQYRRQLHTKLQGTAGDRSPRSGDRQVREVEFVTKEDQTEDDRGVPRYRRGAGNEEAMMTVENAETPRGQHEQSGARKKNAHETNRYLSSFRFESRRD